MGGKTSDTTTTTKLPSYLEDAYKSLLNIGSKVAAQPYQAYSGPTVAGFNQNQQDAFNLVRNSQGLAQPFLNTASQYAAQSAAPISNRITQFSNDELQKYLNPYTSNVIDATLANINLSDAQAQNDLLGKAISSGASPFGGDRAGIAAAELARNQGLARNQTIAQLQSDAYNNALNEFNNQQQVQIGGLTADAANAANAANTFSGLGTTAQTAALQGAQALGATGLLQQQQDQAQLDAAYQTFQNQVNYPKDMASWLASITFGMPSTGGTTTTSQPSGNTLSSLTGLLTAGLGLFAKDGGVVSGYADGGIVPGLGGMSQPFKMGGLGGLPGFAEGGAASDPVVTYTDNPATGITTPMIDTSAFTLSPSQFVPLSNLLTPPVYQTYTVPESITKALENFPKKPPDDKKKTPNDPGDHPGPGPGRPGTNNNNGGGGPMGPFGGGWIGPRRGYDTGGFVSGLSNILSGIVPDALKGKPGELSPLVYAGLGMMASKSPNFVQGIGEGALGGLQAYAQSQHDDKDPNPQILSDGATYKIFYPGTGEIIDTGMSTGKQEAPKAPAIEEFFDPDTGRAYKAEWNAAKGEWSRIGGTKAEEAKAPDTKTVYDAATGREVVVQWNPQTGGWEQIGGTKNDQTTLEQNAIAAGLTPGTPEYRDFIVKGSQPASVNVNTAGESAYAKKTGEAYAEQNQKIIENASVARSTIGNLDQLNNLLTRVYTGAGGEALQDIKRWAQGVGIDLGEVGAGDAARAISNQLALQLRNPATGAGMPGAMSDSDRKFLQAMTPGLAQSPQGNALLIDWNKRVANRALEIDALRRDYVKQHGQLDDGFYEVVDRYAQSHPLFTDADAAALNGGNTAAPTPVATIPQKSIEYLKAHPETAANFDARYGAGSAARILATPYGSADAADAPGSSLKSSLGVAAARKAAGQ